MIHIGYTLPNHRILGTGRLAILHRGAEIRQLGYTHLISLEPYLPPPWAGGCTHIPIADMQPPTRAELIAFCAALDDAERRGEGVVVHCFQGLGRTGTMLAGRLIQEGMSASAAIRLVRKAAADARFALGVPIETAAQERFLAQLEAGFS